MATIGTSASVRDSEGLLRSGLKLGHMRMIVALDDQGQVSAAAQALNVSQPAASRMIAEMEAILAVPLLSRLPRGVELTPYGRALARRARSILLEMREVDREIGELKSGKGGSVFLGAVTAPAIDFAVPAIKVLRERHPAIEINVQIEASAVLARELLASRHDFILARIPDDLNPRLFDARVIGVERACLIVRRGHPLADGQPVNLERLPAYDWVFQPAGSPLRRTVEGIFMSRDLPLPERIVNTTSLLLTLVMVAQTNAISPVSVEVARFIRDENALGGAIEILPVDFDITVRPYSLIKLRNRALSPAAQTLYDLILREIS